MRIDLWQRVISETDSNCKPYWLEGDFMTEWKEFAIPEGYEQVGPWEPYAVAANGCIEWKRSLREINL